MYFAEDNRALLLHCASLNAGPCDNVHVQASWVFSWSWSRSSPRLKRNPIRPDAMYFLLAGDTCKRALHRYARNRRGFVALYCASVCALCAARCGGLRSTRSGQKKVQSWRKGAGSKIAVGPPIPIYIASDRIPSQHVGVGLAQARPNYPIRKRKTHTRTKELSGNVLFSFFLWYSPLSSALTFIIFLLSKYRNTDRSSAGFRPKTHDHLG